MSFPNFIIESLSNELTSKSQTQSWVTAKYAMTLDGKMATYNGDSQWITSKTARLFSRKLRAIHDGVMIGERTARLDNPSLTIDAPSSLKPKRIIFNLSNTIPKHFQVWNNDAPSVFIFSSKATEKQKEAILSRGHQYLICPFLKEKEIDYKQILEKLRIDFGIRSIFVEGGAHLLGDFYRHRLINKIYVFIAPKILGDGLNALSPFSISGVSPFSSMSMASELKKVQILSIGRDFLISGCLK